MRHSPLLETVLFFVVVFCPFTVFSAPTPPTQGMHALRMAAVIEWLKEDIALADSSHASEIAAARKADLAALGAFTPAETPVSKTDDLLPPVPDWDHNPVVAEFFKYLQRKILAPDKRFAKGPEGGKSQTAEGWYFPVRADELLSLTQAFCHPQSPRAGDPALVAPILRRLAVFSEYMAPGGPVLGDFGPCVTIADAYLILRTCRPEILPPSLREGLEQGIQNNADKIIAKSPGWFQDPMPVNNCLVNCDVRYVLTVAIANRLQPNPEYEKAVRAGLKFLEPHILADGATNYLGLQNECATYHAGAVIALARMVQLTGDAQSADMLKRLRWYYPLVVSPGGIMEWSTATSWHHYWNTGNGADGAVIMAGFLNCPHNQRVAALGYGGDLWSASWWDAQRPSAPWPENYTTYDRNVEGPRGRYGLWSFVGTTRKTPGDNRGKSSYVGCVVENAPNPTDKKWALNAALQDAGMEVRLDPANDDGGEHRGRLALANDEKATASAVSERAAALGAVTRLGSYSKPAQPWLTQQVWLFTPERLVGLVRLESEADQTAAGLYGAIYLVSGRNWWGEPKEVQELAPGSFAYGNLVVTFLKHDFAGFAHEYADVMKTSKLHSNTGVQEEKSARLLLMDEAAQSGSKTEYKAGTSHYYLVEVRPNSSAPAKAERLDAKDLLAFSVKDGTGTYRVAFNPGEQPVSWILGQRGTLHLTGEKFRADWLKEAGPVNSLAPQPSPVTYTIPAGEVAFVSGP